MPAGRAVTVVKMVRFDIPKRDQTGMNVGSGDGRAFFESDGLVRPNIKHTAVFSSFLLAMTQHRSPMEQFNRRNVRMFECLNVSTMDSTGS